MSHRPRHRPWRYVIVTALALAASVAMAAVATATYQKKKLVVTKTAVTSYVRTYDWSVAKQAAPSSITTLDDLATFSYTVTATKSDPTDSAFAVSGTITVKNPNARAISGVTVTDAITGGPSCPVQGGVGVTIPAYASRSFAYTCSVASGASGTNVATAAWSKGKATGSAPFAFGSPTTVVNDTVDVTDTFNGGVPVLLAGGDDLNASAVLTYTRTVAVPTTGCSIVPNVAILTSSQELVRQANARVEACRTPPTVTPLPIPPVTVSGTTTSPAALKLVKRGPARALAGQVMAFTITVRNASTATTATSVLVTDVLPTGYSIAKRPIGAVLQKGKLSWRIGDLAPGAAKSVRLLVRVDRTVGGTRCNTARASAGNAPAVSTRACTNVVRVAGAVRIPIVTG